MTPKARAFHLYFSFIRDVIAEKNKAKKCALITVNELIKIGNINRNYWEEVKKEIDKI